MHDDGVIKFDCDWQAAPPWVDDRLGELIAWRDRLFRWGAIGVYPNGIGYGNISQRVDDRCFWVSGTQTGSLPTTGPEHYTQVDRWDIDRNTLHCIGPLPASSESLTHAAIYQHDRAIGAIVHAHHPRLWQQFQHHLPTTRADVPYGTPAMAQEMWRLLAETDLARGRILVMGGHEDGLLSFGPTLAAAAQPLARLLQRGGHASAAELSRDPVSGSSSSVLANQHEASEITPPHNRSNEPNPPHSTPPPAPGD